MSKSVIFGTPLGQINLKSVIFGKPGKHGFSKIDKNTKKHGFRHGRIISNFESAANFRVFGVFGVFGVFECDWPTGLRVLTVLDTVNDTTRGNTF